MLDPLNLIDALLALAAIIVSGLLVGVVWYEVSSFRDFWG
jgi:hypothetical protein